ncbi:MAG: protein-disulfide reductase DsbD [Gammaproteobacteria bacterium]|nr:protein-disulfide reductase DsbD [Gammaproteobacteria bacterium]
MIRKTLLLLLAIMLMPYAQANEDELLDPEVAFAIQVQAVDTDTVRATWKIADGYYMYRDKFVFESTTPGVSLGKPKFQKGKVKNDEFFGKIEVYYKTTSVDIPVSGAKGKVDLVIKSQGCNEPLGVCYPPMISKLSVNMSSSTKSSGGLQSLSGLANNLGLGGQQDELLPPDQAFAFKLQAADGNTLLAQWKIADGYYMYKDKIKFSIKSGDGVTISGVNLPKGKQKDDEFFGKMVVYYKELNAKVLLARENSAAQEIVVTANYQGCSETLGVCYPPASKDISLSLSSGIVGGSSQSVSWSELDLNNSDAVLEYLLNSPIHIVILVSIILGLLIAFTACMYPMIPIVSSIIVGQGDETMSRGKGFFLTLIYVEAMALTFGLIGGIMGGIGGGVGLQAYFQSPWLLIPFAGLFVLLSLSMFGFYEIQVPSALQSKLTNFSNKQKGGNLLGVGFMGALSALIIGPCGGPMLIAMLAYAAGIGTVGEGFVALFAFGNGMGLPLLAVGLLGGELLPRAGNWMNIIKATAGVILLAVALVFLERMPSIFSPGLTTFLWAALFIISAIYMGALEPIKEAASGWNKFRKGFSVILLIYGAVFLIASLTGGSGDLNDPLHGSKLTGSGVVSSSAGGSQASNHFTLVKNVDNLKAELAKGKPVMLDFYADWCTYCKTYEKYVFPDPKVAALMAKFNVIQADVTANDDEDQALLKHVGVFLPPSILFFGPDGKEIRSLRVVGEMDAKQFHAQLEKVLASL